jgi:hypothetical protein
MNIIGSVLMREIVIIVAEEHNFWVGINRVFITSRLGSAILLLLQDNVRNILDQQSASLFHSKRKLKGRTE